MVHRQPKAVSLEYGKNPVPVVTAKGDDEMAGAIIAEARRQGVPVMSDASLVAQLAKIPLGAPIPRDLYVAVAVILSWVYWLKGKTPAASTKPPSDAAQTTSECSQEA
jgi:flagellar biosynthesis protein